MPPVNASSNNASGAGAQAVWQRGQSASSAAQGDAASQPFTVMGRQSAKPLPSSGGLPPGGAPSANSTGAFPRFEWQTLGTLLALQTTGK